MSTIIAREFSFNKDFRSVRWGATFGYNLLRSFFAGLVFGVLIFLASESPQDRSMAMALPFIYPIAYFVVFIPMWALFKLLSRFLGPTWFVLPILAIIAVTAGDPFVCILKSLFPKLIPVEAPPLFSMDMVIFIIDAPELVVL